MKYLMIAIIILGLGKLAWDFTRPAKMAVDRNVLQSAQISLPELSAVEMAGKGLFDANCASCHGINAQGVDGAGPTFIHKIYEPNHHADITFYRAAQFGVRAHHWPYGNMPKQPQVMEADVQKIIAYIRKLQKHNGVF